MKRSVDMVAATFSSSSMATKYWRNVVARFTCPRRLLSCDVISVTSLTVTVNQTQKCTLQKRLVSGAATCEALSRAIQLLHKLGNQQKPAYIKRSYDLCQSYSYTRSVVHVASSLSEMFTNNVPSLHRTSSTA